MNHKIEAMLHIIASSGDDGVRQSDIQAELGIPRRTLYTNLRKLEDDGLIERLLDLTDTRRVLYRLTETGKERLRGVII